MLSIHVHMFNLYLIQLCLYRGHPCTYLSIHVHIFNDHICWSSFAHVRWVDDVVQQAKRDLIPVVFDEGLDVAVREEILLNYIAKVHSQPRCVK